MSVRTQIERINGEVSEQAALLAQLDAAVDALPDAGGGGVEDSIVTRSITNYTNDRITELGNSALAYCRSLTSVNLPLVTKLDSNAMAYCTSLTTVYIPLLKTTNTAAFRGCSNLASVDFSNIVTVGGYIVADCPLIKHLRFPLATSVQNNAFANCRGLITAEFAQKVDISSYVFNNCTSLEAAIFRGTEMSTLSHAQTFAGSKVAAGTGYIYVPAALIDTYKAATNWSNYANQFRAIEDYPEICEV